MNCRAGGFAVLSVLMVRKRLLLFDYLSEKKKDFVRGGNLEEGRQMESHKSPGLSSICPKSLISDKKKKFISALHLETACLQMPPKVVTKVVSAAPLMRLSDCRN